MTVQTVVSRDEWLAARLDLLAKEKELTRQRDELACQRRHLPWVQIEKPYVFDGSNGALSLAEMFDGRSQLAVYHFMFGPEWEQGCPSCSMAADGFDAVIPHLNQRDITFTAVSRAPMPKLAAFQQRMGWRFPWVSSYANSFNRDFQVSFTAEELAAGNSIYNYVPSRFPSDEAPGVSIFFKDPLGNIFHTYSTFARGLEPLLGEYFFLDIVPKGRDEQGLPWPMAWVRHHDRYEGALAHAGCCGEHP
ncbi:MAG: thioredoxin family protein [Acidobacteriota bacterium]